MMVYPTGRTTSTCSLIWYMPSPHCNGCFPPSPHTQNQLVQHFLRHSIENVEINSPVQHNASPDKNSRTTVMVSFLDVTGIKPCPDLSPNQNALTIAFGTEPTLIRKEDTTPLTVVQFLCSLNHCERCRRWSTFNGRQRSGRRLNRSPL
ncbi:uncharacterized protein TNCV_908501 [Trichonephila clavipes]|nr:uncharacterized protein TNCV_908501 [Trichonephila clavipes]